MRVAIPRFGEEVAPCFEYSATIAIFIVSRGKVLEQKDYALQSQEASFKEKGGGCKETHYKDCQENSKKRCQKHSEKGTS